MAKKKKRAKRPVQQDEPGIGYTPTEEELAAAEKLHRREERKEFFNGFLKKKWVLGAFAIAVAGSIGLGALADASNNETHYLTPHQIVQEYADSEVAADFKYAEKTVVVTGLVDSIGEEDVLGLGTRLIVKLQDEESASIFDAVECYFTTLLADTPEVAALTAGQKVSIQGTFLGISGLPMVGACSLV